LEGKDMGSITFEHEYVVDNYIIYVVNVASGSFSGASSFCLSKDALRGVLVSLSEMHSKLEGACQMNDYDSDDFVLFEFLKMGHLKISGQIGGGHNQQYLVFQFTTDQAALNKIISNFRSVINI